MFYGLPWHVWLKRRRKELGWTQKDLEVKVSYSVETIGKIERGLLKPSPQLATLAADAFGVPDTERAAFLRAALGIDPISAAAEPRHPRLALRIPGLPVTPLVGREDVLDSVVSSLAKGEQRLVTITGPGGVGKTRLAMAAAQRLEEYYQDGVCWVALTAVSDRSAVLGAVADALRIKEAAYQSLADAVLQALQTRILLLVLDNCEQIPGIGSVLTELLTAPGVRILTTSRRRLRLRGEQQISLTPLALPPITLPLSGVAVGAYAAVELFVARAHDTEHGFKLDNSNAAAIAQICVALDGLPLALELAAVRIRTLPPAAMLQHLAARLSWMVGGPEDLPPHQQTLKGALAWSYNLLNPQQQLLFRRLSVFADGFTLAAAAAVCGERDELGASLIPLIDELDDWNLLYRTSTPTAEPRYAMLETIHKYALEHFDNSAEVSKIRNNHLNYFMILAEQAGRPGMSGDEEMARLGSEQANLRAALAWGLSAGDDTVTAWRLGIALGWFWEVKGYWQEGRHWLGQLLARPEAATTQLEAPLRYLAGRFAYLQGDYGSATQSLQASLPLARAKADTQTEIQALNTLGWIAYSQGDYRQAGRFYTMSRDAAYAHEDLLNIAEALHALGGVALALGDGARAVDLFNESLVVRRQQGDRQGMGRSFNGLGLAAQAGADHVAARGFFSESVELLRPIGDKLGLTLALSNLGWTLLEEGDPDQAQTYLLEALDLAEQIGSSWGRALALCYLGWLSLEQAQPDDAAHMLGESLALAQSQDSKQVAILARLGLARLALNAGDYGLLAMHMRLVEQLLADLNTHLPPLELRLAEPLRQALREHTSESFD